MKGEKIKERIYSTFANIAKSIGYSEVYGRIIACLLIHEEPSALNDVAKETGYSPSMISLSVDFLESIGMVKRVKKAGDKKLYLQSTGNLLDGLKKAVLMKIEKNISESLNEFEQYKSKLKELKNTESESLSKTIKKLENEIKRLDSYVKILSQIKFP
jgi:DNA-binding transcriptional regulator GbsR (MarR family)